jgi:hypothetical protein
LTKSIPPEMAGPGPSMDPPLPVPFTAVNSRAESKSQMIFPSRAE